MLFIFAKNGFYYQFLSNTTFWQNEAKLLHEYGLGIADLRHKRRWKCVVRCTSRCHLCTNCSKKSTKESFQCTIYAKLWWIHKVPSIN